MKYKKVALSALILSSFLINDNAFANSLSEIHEEKKKLEDKSKIIKDNASQTKNTINNLNSRISETEKELFTLETEITELTSQINKLNDEITVLENKIAETTSKIEELTIVLENKKAILKEHLVNMYTGGGKLSFIEMVVRSENIGDLFKRIDIYKEISMKADELNKEIETTLATIELKKSKLEEDKNTLNTTKSTIETNKNLLITKQSDKETLITKLHSEKEAHEHDLDEQENALSSISNELTAMEATIQAKIKEEEDAKKRALESSKTNTTSTTANSKSTANTLNKHLTTSGTLGLPIAKGQFYISSGFGYRTDPVYGGTRFHSGTDYAAPYGTPIYAVESGYVLFSGPASSYGHWVVIKHDNGLYSIYGHMYSNQLYVTPGQRVERGQHIAAVGSDGKSTGNHLHLCIATSYVNGKFNYVNPLNYY